MILDRFFQILTDGIHRSEGTGCLRARSRFPSLEAATFLWGTAGANLFRLSVGPAEW